MTYATLHQCLTEAEELVKNTRLPQPARDSSAETVQLILQRMKAEGLTRSDLKADYDRAMLQLFRNPESRAA